jgi:signal transduction histidine kinase
MFFINIESYKKDSFENLESINHSITNILLKNIKESLYKNDKEKIKHFIDSIDSKYISNILVLDKNQKIIYSKKQIDDVYQKRISYIIKNGELKSQEVYITLDEFEFLGVSFGYMIIDMNMQIYTNNIKNKILEYVYTFLILSVVIFIMSYYIVAKMSKPIEKIVKTIKTTKKNEDIHFEKQKFKEFIYLAKTIESTQNRIIYLNKNLEQEVDKKTEELRELNKNLEFRVKEEVSKNREKDRHILEQSRLAKMGEMISMIAHQWRQPLQSISATTSAIEIKLMLEEDINKEFITDQLHKISSYSQDLSKTIDGFRNFFKPSKTKEYIKLDNIVNSVISIIGDSLKSNNINLSLDLKNHDEVYSYENELKHVVLNLIKNSEDIIMERKIDTPYIWINTYSEGESTIIEIIDNGGGIDKEIIDKIFEPYFSTKSEKNGSGLGLYISKMIVEKHCGGKLLVESYENIAKFKIVL